MSKNTKIAWTDHTANFWLGCTKVSEGCRNCYAETFATGRMGLDVWGGGKARKPVQSVYGNLKKLQRNAEQGVPGVLGEGYPHLVFVGSMMDWAEDHPDADLIRPHMWDVIRRCPNLHFQLLTKRPERIASTLPDDWGPGGYPNVWLGCSVEDNRVAHRVKHLVENPALVHFVSYEPAIGPLDQLDLEDVEWVIYGGESGAHRRPEDKQWARDMRQRCMRRGISFFHKQSAGYRSETGIELDGEIIREFPQIPAR